MGALDQRVPAPLVHPGEAAVRRRAGFPREVWGTGRVGSTIPPVAAAFLARQPFVVLGAEHAGAVWCTALHGAPGLLRAVDDETVEVAATPPDADPLAGAFDAGPTPTGMLALEPATRRRMRVNGPAGRAGPGLVLRTEQVYANCPKYIQERSVVGVRSTAAPVRSHVGRTLTADQQAWAAGADTFFIATRAPALGADASHRGGPAGFLTATATRLSWPDYAGNSMYMTLGNLEVDDRAGLLLLDWQGGRSLHLSGRAHTDWDRARTATIPGALRVVDFDVEQVVEVRDSIPHRWRFDRPSRHNPTGQEMP